MFVHNSQPHQQPHGLLGIYTRIGAHPRLFSKVAHTRVGEFQPRLEIDSRLGAHLCFCPKVAHTRAGEFQPRSEMYPRRGAHPCILPMVAHTGVLAVLPIAPLALG